MTPSLSVRLQGTLGGSALPSKSTGFGCGRALGPGRLAAWKKHGTSHHELFMRNTTLRACRPAKSTATKGQTPPAVRYPRLLLFALCSGAATGTSTGGLSGASGTAGSLGPEPGAAGSFFQRADRILAELIPALRPPCASPTERSSPGNDKLDRMQCRMLGRDSWAQRPSNVFRACGMPSERHHHRCKVPRAWQKPAPLEHC